jgi:hypothetical protein
LGTVQHAPEPMSVETWRISYWRNTTHAERGDENNVDMILLPLVWQDMIMMHRGWSSEFLSLFVGFDGYNSHDISERHLLLALISFINSC